MEKSNPFNKDAARSVTNRFVADVTGLIYNGLVHQVPKNRVLRQIKSELDWYKTKIGGISYLAAHKIWLAAVKSYQDTSKTAYLSLRKIPSDINYQEKLKMRSNGVFDALKSKVIESNTLSSATNWVLNEKEYAQKSENLVEMLEKSRESGSYSPFYVSDSHANCAKDHLAYESKVYYDEKYTEYVVDEKELVKINAYIRNHKCMSVQEVVGAPHYFLTRPNCKHRIENVPVEEILGSSIRKIQIRRKMIVAYQPKSQQEIYARAYKAKYEQYAALWSIMPNDKLAQRMKETKHLYRKWSRRR